MLAHERPGVKVTIERHTDGLKPHLVISDEAYYELIEELIVAVKRSGGLPSQLVGIMWGGAAPARVLHLLADIPVAYLGAESYRPDADGDRRAMAIGANIQFSRDLLRTAPGFGTDILIVDDLTEKGRTLHDSVAWLRSSPKYGPFIARIRTACLWHKRSSEFIPDIFIDEAVFVQPEGLERPMLPWIDQPLEWRFAIPTFEDIERRVEARVEVRRTNQ